MGARLSEDTSAEQEAVACGGKARFVDPHAAERRARRMRRRHDKPFTSYRCQFCRGWHIGSRDGWNGDK